MSSFMMKKIRWKKFGIEDEQGHEEPWLGDTMSSYHPNMNDTTYSWKMRMTRRPVHEEADIGSYKMEEAPEKPKPVDQNRNWLNDSLNSFPSETFRTWEIRNEIQDWDDFKLMRVDTIWSDLAFFSLDETEAHI